MPMPEGVKVTTVLQEHRQTVAFDHRDGGYRFVATYLTEPIGDALIEILKGDEVIRAFLWPAYKIWNIAAHASDIAASLDAGHSDGLYLAGEIGFGANVYSE